ncbi:hypothetical protein PsYK624_114450 [Phanerochaete sordida]|uniref:Uncharacterized protein n=1 Tax=Phanerochaete sordida TaxID=48140 RepID=A0A9P3LIK6_9APHY|nr:hypothetical protein PsYK624_114450 [Phanerochaete sordida]
MLTMDSNEDWKIECPPFVGCRASHELSVKPASYGRRFISAQGAAGMTHANRTSSVASLCASPSCLFRMTLLPGRRRRLRIPARPRKQS